MGCLRSRSLQSFAVLLFLFVSSRCVGQQGSVFAQSAGEPVLDAARESSSAALPDDPDVQLAEAAKDAGQTAGTKAPSPDEQQTKRIMGMLPNFRSVSAGEVVPPENFKQKMLTATEDNFDYTSLFFAGIIAGDSFVTKSTPEFHQGAAGFARYYWHTVADQAVENYFVELIVPQMTHEDSRYYALGREGGGFWKRAGYSFSRVVVTRKDDGKKTFNISEVAGSGAAVTVSTFYYPTPERTVANGFRNWGLDMTYDAVTFVFHEFWPDISHAILPHKNKLK